MNNLLVRYHSCELVTMAGYHGFELFGTNYRYPKCTGTSKVEVELFHKRIV